MEPSEQAPCRPAALNILGLRQFMASSGPPNYPLLLMIEILHYLLRTLDLWKTYGIFPMRGTAGCMSSTVLHPTGPL